MASSADSPQTHDEHPPDAAPSARTAALETAVKDLERHASTIGWDGPVVVCALVNTTAAVAENPQLREEIPADALNAAHTDPDHLLSIEQDGLPDSADLEELLAQLAWPDTVDGAAIVVERIVVPPEAEADLPSDPQEQIDALTQHPAREDVRIAVGVLRTGETWCALRTRRNDDDDAVAGAPDAVPGLVAALRATLN